jgi:hypothetical protein
MLKFTSVFLAIIVLFNSCIFITENPIYMKIIGHGLFMPFVGIIYGMRRNWQFGYIDQLIYLTCLLGGVCDIVIFFDLNEKGEFLQIVTNFFVHFIFIIIFRKEGAFVFNIGNTNSLKILLPAFISFFFFGFVLLNILPNLIFFVAILYTVQIAILVVLGFYRPASSKSYWLVAIGLTVIMLRDILYSYFFYVYHGSYHLLYIPLYLTNAIGYYLIINGITINQNEKKQVYEKISKKVIVNSINSVFKKKVKSNVFESIFLQQ